MPVWDPTKSAESHAALAGVLAGIVLAVLAIFLQSSGDDAHRDEDPERRASIHSTGAMICRMLIVSLFLLIVAAVMWGGLAGQPSAADLHSSGESPSIQGEEALELIVAASAVTVLAVGALTFVSAIMQMISMAFPEQNWHRFLGTALSLVCSLGIYEVAYFCWSAVKFTFGMKKELDPNVLAVAMLLLVLATTLPVRAERPYRAVESRLRASGVGDVIVTGRAGIWLASVTGLIAVLAYVLAPSDNYATDPIYLSDVHRIAACVDLLSSLSFAGFSIVVVWSMASTMGELAATGAGHRPAPR